MSADALLSRLDQVRSSGHGRWTACCPAHADSSPSLAVRELDDGRVLVHCFAGCEPQRVLASVGLSFDDLFPARIGGDLIKRERQPFNAVDVFRCVACEALVVRQYANLLAKGDKLTVGDGERLRTAAARLLRAAEMVDA